MKIEGYRKIIIGLIFLVIGTWMTFVIEADSRLEIYLNYLIWLGGLLIAGNGVEHVARKFNRHN